MNKRENLVMTLSETLMNLSRRMWSHRSERLDHHNYGPSQIKILIMIGRSGSAGRTTKELAEALGITSGAVSQMVEPLVEEKMVERQEDPNDRRVTRLNVTRHAERKFSQFKAAKAKYLAKMLEPLTEAEIAELIRLLEKINTQGDPHA